MLIYSKDFNIRVHVFLAVMGLLFYRYLAWKTKKYNLSLKEIIDVLSRNFKKTISIGLIIC